VASALQKRVALLIVGFAGLPEPSQSEFLDALNLYLYASPQRRTQLSRQWQEALGAPDALAVPVSRKATGNKR